jgi:hypothetical protein
VCAQVVAMLGQSTQTELMQVSVTVPTVTAVKDVKMPTANVEMLAQYFLRHGAQLSPKVFSLFFPCLCLRREHRVARGK